MAENSRIEWTDHTFNPWIGCTKVSPGCKHCYAEHETLARVQRSKGIETWGPQGTRIRTSEANWRKPLAWNKSFWCQCTVCGWRGVYGAELLCPGCDHPMIRVMVKTRQRVFCASMADVGDHHPSVQNAWIDDLVRLISLTPNLDWLFLTKRVEDVIARYSGYWGSDQWPENVWMGTSIENQEAADKRIPELLKIPAKMRFLSCEPLLGPIDLGHSIPCGYYCDEAVGHVDHPFWSRVASPIHLVIAGGESGAKARLSALIWLRGLLHQCQFAGVPFFFKQWGEWAPISQLNWVTDETKFKHQPIDFYGEKMVRVGKGLAGRVLDGKTWDLWPERRDR